MCVLICSRRPPELKVPAGAGVEQKDSRPSESIFVGVLYIYFQQGNFLFCYSLVQPNFQEPWAVKKKKKAGVSNWEELLMLLSWSVRNFA